MLCLNLQEDAQSVTKIKELSVFKPNGYGW